MKAYLGEFLGTCLLITLGNGVVANVTLEKSGMKGAGSIQITIAWGLAVMIPAYIFGAQSGAIFNPAMALAMAVDGSLAWGNLPGYIAAELLGAMAGQLAVWLMYKDHFDATDDPATKLGCFSTSPSIRNIPRNMLCEVIGTFILMFAIKGMEQVEGMASGLSSLYVFGVICAIGMSLGGTTGYALNPARDMGPRIMYQLLPIQNKGSCHWDYALVPVVGPVIGALLGVAVYGMVFG